MRRLSLAWLVVGLVAAPFQRPGFAQSLVPARPELLGMSSSRLARVDSTINTYIRDHRMPVR